MIIPMTSYVLFGITGDLAAKKILPALADLFEKNLLPQPFTIIGVSRKNLTTEDLRAQIDQRANLSDRFLEHVVCVSGGYGEADTHASIKSLLPEGGRALFHLSVPPSAYAEILTGLAEGGVAGNHPILIEKPFGTSLETAKALQKLVEKHFSEEQLFRIDHYLAKGGPQNILAKKLRGEAVWNKSTIKHVHVATYETMTVAGRVGFYDGVGALRDVLQNHLLEVLATVLMNQPETASAEDIREARTKALRMLPPFSETNPPHIVRGQYEGYLEDAQVAASDTETYIRIESELTGDLAGTTFTLEGGKALSKTVHAIILTHIDGTTETIDINETPESPDTLTNYGRLMFDALAGDQTLFAAKEEVLAAWEYVTPILEHFPSLPLSIYPKGADGV